MKGFDFKRVIVFLLLGGIAWWDVELARNWLKFLNNKNDFELQRDEFVALKERVQKTDKTRTESEILADLDGLRNQIFENLRVRYSNAELLGFIAKTAAALGLTDVRPTIEKNETFARFTGDTWEKTRLKVDFRARYHEAARLINILEQSPYLIRVLGYSINRGTKDPTGPTFTKVIADFYRLK